MKKLTLNVLLIATLAVIGSTQDAFGVETPLTDYSRAVILDNPTYYWTFNETGATDVAQEVMRYESEGQMLAVGDATRAVSYSSELGNAASFNDNAAFWAGLVNRGDGFSAYAIELWMKADSAAGSGYVADFLGDPISGDSPGILHGYTGNHTELWFGGPRTGATAELNLSDDQWHHVVLAVNCDGVTGTLDQIDVAIDGVVTTGVAMVDTKRINLRGALTIGAWATTDANGYAPGTTATGAASCFEGQIDEFAIYDLAGMDTAAVAAKVNDIANHYALASTPNAITPFAPVAASEVSYSIVGGNGISSGYTDSTGSELSDNVYAGNDASKAVGFYGVDGGEGYTELEFDLGEVKTLDAMWVDHFSGGRWGINAPVSVELSFSVDGVNFGDTILFDDINNAGDPLAYNFYERRDQIDIDGVEAQYVRAKFGFASNYVFLSEVQFMEQISEVPEPSTIILLVSAIASLCLWRRMHS